jgi:hypothetical protein
MPEHEYFEELCAVAAIGQLSEGEMTTLAEHLKTCYQCRRTAGEFAFLLNQLPIEEGSADERKMADVLSQSHRERFLARARSEGVQFSPAAEQAPAASWSLRPKLQNLRLIAIPALAAIALAAVILPKFAERNTPPLSATFGTPAVPDRALVISPEQHAENSSAQTGLGLENQKLRAQLARAQGETSKARVEAEMANARAQEADQQLRSTRGEMEQAVAEAEKLRTARDAASAEVVAQQYRVNALNEEIKKQRTSVEQDGQLASVTKDIREMMGARNLHIIDVFDADGSGRQRKSFGRVFYVEGKSLIFYAFDLKQKSSGTTKVSFQAWGQRDGSRDKPRSLGVFYVDDHAQGRWVLKVEDPAKLASIDSVFVTVEPLGGGDRPTGQKLLYAFLGSSANHP